LGLEYGTIDLLMGLDNQYYFLEVNSSGDWYWLEKETAQPITQSIIDTIKMKIKN
jgi:glutathione synthase/RimK-type ligase-like ATP-grasp enzyme